MLLTQSGHSDPLFQRGFEPLRYRCLALGRRAMRRREFITFLGSAVAAWPLPARAQKPSQPVIGYIGLTSHKGEAEMAGSFLRGLKEAGFEEGRNVTVEFLFAARRCRPAADACRRTRRRNVSIILTGTTAGTVAAKRVTSTVPIVFVIGADPIKAGLVTQLNHPGAN